MSGESPFDLSVLHSPSELNLDAQSGTIADDSGVAYNRSLPGAFQEYSLDIDGVERNPNSADARESKDVVNNADFADMSFLETVISSTSKRGPRPQASPVARISPATISQSSSNGGVHRSSSSGSPSHYCFGEPGDSLNGSDNRVHTDRTGRPELSTMSLSVSQRTSVSLPKIHSSRSTGEGSYRYELSWYEQSPRAVTGLAALYASLAGAAQTRAMPTLSAGVRSGDGPGGGGSDGGNAMQGFDEEMAHIVTTAYAQLGHKATAHRRASRPSPAANVEHATGTSPQTPLPWPMPPVPTLEPVDDVRGAIGELSTTLDQPLATPKGLPRRKSGGPPRWGASSLLAIRRGSAPDSVDGGHVKNGNPPNKERFSPELVALTASGMNLAQIRRAAQRLGLPPSTLAHAPSPITDPPSHSGSSRTLASGEPFVYDADSPYGVTWVRGASVAGPSRPPVRRIAFPPSPPDTGTGPSGTGGQASSPGQGKPSPSASEPVPRRRWSDQSYPASTQRRASSTGDAATVDSVEDGAGPPRRNSEPVVTRDTAPPVPPAWDLWGPGQGWPSSPAPSAVKRTPPVHVVPVRPPLASPPTAEGGRRGGPSPPESGDGKRGMSPEKGGPLTPPAPTAPITPTAPMAITTGPITTSTTPTAAGLSTASDGDSSHSTSLLSATALPNATSGRRLRPKPSRPRAAVHVAIPDTPMDSSSSPPPPRESLPPSSPSTPAPTRPTPVAGGDIPLLEKSRPDPAGGIAGRPRVTTLPVMPKHRPVAAPTREPVTGAGLATPSPGTPAPGLSSTAPGLSVDEVLPQPPPATGILARRGLYRRGVGPHPRRPGRRRRFLPNGQRRANWVPPETHYITCLSAFARVHEEEEEAAVDAVGRGGAVVASNGTTATAPTTAAVEEEQQQQQLVEGSSGAVGEGRPRVGRGRPAPLYGGTRSPTPPPPRAHRGPSPAGDSDDGGGYSSPLGSVDGAGASIVVDELEKLYLARQQQQRQQQQQLDSAGSKQSDVLSSLPVALGRVLNRPSSRNSDQVINGSFDSSLPASGRPGGRRGQPPSLGGSATNRTLVEGRGSGSSMGVHSSPSSVGAVTFVPGTIFYEEYANGLHEEEEEMDSGELGEADV